MTSNNTTNPQLTLQQWAYRANTTLYVLQYTSRICHHRRTHEKDRLNTHNCSAY